MHYILITCSLFRNWVRRRNRGGSWQQLWRNTEKSCQLVLSSRTSSLKNTTVRRLNGTRKSRSLWRHRRDWKSRIDSRSRVWRRKRTLLQRQRRSSSPRMKSSSTGFGLSSQRRPKDPNSSLWERKQRFSLTMSLSSEELRTEPQTSRKLWWERRRCWAHMSSSWLKKPR